MSDAHNIPILISQYVASIGSNNNEDNISQNYVSEIISLFTTNQLTLLQFVQHLGPTLTSDNEVMRSRGMQFLSSVLGQLPKQHLSRQDIGVMVEFLMNKFDDKLSLIHALGGINSLIGCKQYTASLNSEKILAKLLNGYDPRKNLAKVRYEAFQVMNSLLSNITFITSSVPDLYVKTFIHIASGEKDPRNLLQSFKLNKLINEEFEFTDSDVHKEFVTDLFDVCFCYFPISFTPPANDPYKITAEELKLDLRKVIASQSKFASESIPSLVEKLASTNPMIRNDTLKTIAMCVENYTVETINLHWLSLWNALKFEILHNDCAVFKPTMESIVPSDYASIDDNDDVKVLFLTLVILNAIVKKLPQPEAMLQTVVDELGPNLQKDKAKPSAVILSSLASVSVDNYNFVIDYLFGSGDGPWGKYFDVVVSAQEDTDMDKNEDLTLNIAKQRDLVDNLGFILISHPLSESHLIEYKDHLLVFLCQILSNSSNLEKTLRCKVVQQLSKLMTLPNFLSPTNMQLILLIFKGIIEENIASGKKDIVVDEIVVNLSLIMEKEPLLTSSIIDEIVNPILAKKDIFESNLKYVLDVIQQLTTNHQILEVVSIRIMNKSGLTIDRSHTIVDFFISLFDKVETIQPFLTNSWYKKFIPNLMNLLMQLVPNDAQSASELALLEVSGDLIRIIIRFIHVSKHQSILDEMWEVFCTNGEKSKVFQYQGNLLLSPSAYMSIYNKILSAIDKSCKLDAVNESVSAVTTTILSTLKDKYLRVQYLQHLCLIVNKFTAADFFSPELNFTNLNQFEIYIWTLKAKLLKIEPSGISLLVDLLETFQSPTTLPQHRQLIINALPLLVIDLKLFINTPAALSRKIISNVNNLNVKLLYKQQVFERMLPYLVKQDGGRSDDSLSIQALALILPHITQKILVPHLPTFIPFIITAITTTDSNSAGSQLQQHLLLINKAGLNILEIILEENAVIVQLKLSIIIPQLMKLATDTGTSSCNGNNVRQLALRNLVLVFTKFDQDVVEKYKSLVVKQLEICLDDKRRSVRKSAIDLRQILYEMR